MIWGAHPYFWKHPCPSRISPSTGGIPSNLQTQGALATSAAALATATQTRLRCDDKDDGSSCAVGFEEATSTGVSGWNLVTIAGKLVN